VEEETKAIRGTDTVSKAESSRLTELLNSNYEVDRKRSSSFHDSVSFKTKHLIVKKGIMKKKGIIFYNSRFV